MPLRPVGSQTSQPIPPLLPAAELQIFPSTKKQRPYEDVKSLAMDIERPRSALHAGDFTHDGQPNQDYHQESSRPAMPTVFPSSQGPLGRSPTTPWYKPSPPSREIQHLPSSFRERDYENHGERRSARDRAPSLASSFSSSSYILKAPTTPLVQQSNNTDLDFPARDRSSSPDKASRRHTLPAHALQSLHAYASSPSSTASLRQQPQPQFPSSYQREGNLPFVHRSRRSLTSNWTLQHSASPSTPPFIRSRRTSFSSEASPLQHASMVGSYEESILRGRMSTAPSRPVDFTAQIGVLGRGNCKPKCPAHVTVPFPAVYYNWAAGNGRSPINDEPSPYVGHIDLQHTLSKVASRGSVEGRADSPTIDREEQHLTPGSEMNNNLGPRSETERPRKRKRAPAVAPPNGSYRIPEQGQLQIIIKNPNKTAVKLFLVPYDLTGMEPGTKTFVRQRLYSASPNLGKPLASISTLKISPFEKKEKPTLRYLIHVNICSPCKGRFYLYQHIRVVFANRVPDNKEQLSTEIQVPEPRYSIWKPSSMSRQPSSAGAKLTAEKAFRRRSSGFDFGDKVSSPWTSKSLGGGSAFPFFGDEAAPPVPPIPFHLPTKMEAQQSDNDHNESDAMDIDTSRPTTASGLKSPQHKRLMQNAESFRSNSSQGSSDYEKLSRGDCGYGGVFGCPSTPEPGEGLLARRLKNLGVQRHTSMEGANPDI